MKTAYLFVLICSFNLSVFCQKTLLPELHQFIENLNAKAAQHPQLMQQQHSNNAAPAIRMPANLLLKPDSLKLFLKPLNVKSKNKVIREQGFFSGGEPTNLCADTSYSRLLGVQNGWLYIHAATATADGGVLIPAMMYDSTALPNPWWKCFGLLIKLDGNGNVVWLKQFEAFSAGTYSSVNMTRVFELPNHDIICTAFLDTSSTSDVPVTVVYRLTSNGSIIWQNGLNSTLAVFNSPPGTFSIYPEAAIEGLNGDLILCGTASANTGSAKHETVIRFNSAGQVVWDANYGNHLASSYTRGAEGVSVFMQNGQIVLVGLTHGSGSPETASAINFLTLDYNNGSLVTKRFFRPSYANALEGFYKSFTYWTNECTRLSNGHFIFYGKLFSDYANPNPVKDHFGVVEFDAAFNLVSAYTISSGLTTNYSNNLLHFDKTGRGLISVFEYISSYEGNVFFGAFNNLQFQNQRKSHYVNAGMPGNNSFAFLNDNSYVYLQTYFEADPVTKSYFELRKMHNSDTSSVCLGKDTMLLNFLPLNIIEDPAYYFLDTNESNKVIAQAQIISLSDTLSTSSRNPCVQTNFCDTVKIHGNPVICGSSPSAVFSVFKNTACGAIVQWDIDYNAMDSLSILSDTSVKVWFKNINWTGKLYASITAGVCYTSVVDSLDITVIALQSLRLGADTILCSQNTMVLHAGNSFSNYLWQDGSTDSTFTVQLPGIYYVTASDLCGNTLTDTVQITAAVFPFTIGADTVRCNRDTIQLTATPGFSNYQWYNNYNMSAASAMSVNVYPVTDTFYYATAEKWPGCRVRDSINISVRSSPPIYLGADTSLCTAQLLSLDAGTGFATYEWSNGSVNQQLIVNQAGTYIVKATAANGCASYDTLKILNISPLPVFSLGPDSTVCTGKVVTFQFNLPNATYLWQDGNTGNQYSVNNAGQYNLAVTQAGCTAKDTVIIQYKTSPVVFLGKDSIICAGNNYLLQAGFPGATYKWQDGSVQPQYLVTGVGNYNVQVSLDGCYAYDTIAILYLPQPVFNLGKDSSICTGQSYLLQPVVNTVVNYLWQDGSNAAAFEINKPGLFSLRVSNKCGSYSDSIIVTQGLCKLIMPNSFTPNNDGINDLFRVKYPFAVKEFKLSVYNRYGEKIFETADMFKGWDGSYRSVKQETGSYIWQISIKGINDLIETRSGVITLIH